MKFKNLVGGLLAGAALLAACGNEGSGTNVQDDAFYDERETIVIGSLYANSGAYSAYGQPQTNAVQLAFEEINAAGGIKGKQIELVEYDYSSDEQEASSLSTRLATEDEVNIISRYYHHPLHWIVLH